jgi:VWFA-related protein
MIPSRFVKLWFVLIAAGVLFAGQFVFGQGDGGRRARGAPRPVTVPVTIRLKKPEVEVRVVDLLVFENGDVQQQLSRRYPSDSPITLAVLLQDGLVPSVSNEAKGIAAFIQSLPAGSRVMVAYIRTGSLYVRRKFTTDLDRAAAAVRPPMGIAGASAYNPFIEVVEGLRRYDSQPQGRRAMIVVSDGLDLSRGIESSGPNQSIDLNRAITEAQRRGVAIYSIYPPAAAVPNNQLLISNGQSNLLKLSDDTGGRAFFQGTGAPVSFDPFLKEISESLDRQIALTYLSTHPNKGYHRLEVKPMDRDVEVRHPSGYTR